MSKGLTKPKKYDWKDSNLFMFGSDTEKKVKKSSAESEPAWKNAGKAPGVIVWRVEKFAVKPWPKEDYGQFYSGDSYIILYTYKNEDGDSLAHDVFFWIGKASTQDEYGTAAYKTVELDTYLDDVPVQHRECQGYESEVFKSVFPKGITTMEGGCDSGFRSVPPEQYVPRLFHFCRDKSGNIAVRQIPRAAAQINEGDVYILDCGNKFYQYNGASCSPLEKAKAATYLVSLRSNRGDAETEVLEGESTPKSHDFWDKLNDADDDFDSDDNNDGIPDPRLLVVNTETKTADIVKKGKYGLDDLKTDDVFLCDTGPEVYVWVGKGASDCEKKNGIFYAHNYLRTSGFPCRPVTIIKEGQNCRQFITAIAA